MNRRLQREHIFKLLFSYEFDLNEGFESHMDFYLNELESDDEKAKQYIKEKTLKIIDKLPEIDEKINANTVDWDTKRIAKVEVAIIRVAVYEIFFDEEIPTSVAINEAVEISKQYGGENAPSFVNGVLAGIVKAVN